MQPERERHTRIIIIRSESETTNYMFLKISFKIEIESRLLN